MLKPTSLFLSLIISFILFMSSSVNGVSLQNRTIDDFDPTIIYMPSDHWQGSNNLTCVGCLQPDPQFAAGKTFHYGFHPNLQATPSPSATNPQSVSPTTVTTDSEHESGEDHSESGKDGGRSCGKQLCKLKPRDDGSSAGGEVDIPVSATVNFTGAAVYIFCIVPTSLNNAGLLSTTDLTFTLDGEPVQFTYQHKPQVELASPTSFNYTMPPVLSVDNLTMRPHSLSIFLKTDSMVFLDKIVISELTGDGGSTPNVIDTPPKSAHGKNTATFGIAIGITLGGLAVLSLAVFISLCYRRRKSALHSKIHEARLASVRPLSPEMRGVGQPFLPRYFPGSPPYRPPPTRPEGSRRSSLEIGPSHGLNYPLAPDAPPYSPPHTMPSLATTMSRLTIPLVAPLRPPLSRLPDDGDVIPPSYNEAQSTPPVTVPAYSPPSAGQSTSPSLSTDSVSPTGPSAVGPASTSTSLHSSSGKGQHGSPPVVATERPGQSVSPASIDGLPREHSNS